MFKKSILWVLLIAGFMMTGIFVISLSSCDDLNLYGISLSQSGTYTFPSAVVGYEQQAPLSVTARNHSADNIWATTSITGPNADVFGINGHSEYQGFTLGGTSLTYNPNMNISTRHTFTVFPVTGLASGTYTATVNVVERVSRRIWDSFDVSFTVY